MKCLIATLAFQPIPKVSQGDSILGNRQIKESIKGKVKRCISKTPSATASQAGRVSPIDHDRFGYAWCACSASKPRTKLWLRPVATSRTSSSSSPTIWASINLVATATPRSRHRISTGSPDVEFDSLKRTPAIRSAHLHECRCSPGVMDG